MSGDDFEITATQCRHGHTRGSCTKCWDDEDRASLRTEVSQLRSDLSTERQKREEAEAREERRRLGQAETERRFSEKCAEASTALLNAGRLQREEAVWREKLAAAEKKLDEAQDHLQKLATFRDKLMDERDALAKRAEDADLRLQKLTEADGHYREGLLAACREAGARAEAAEKRAQEAYNQRACDEPT